MNLIRLWLGDWVNNMVKMNQVVCEKNRLDTSVGSKFPVRPFTRNNLWKFIRCILLAVTFGVLNNMSVRRSKLYCEIHYT